MCVATALLLAAPALAQTNPNSTQNVPPAVGGAALGGIEARRQALFQQMLADPSNLDVAFEYAALSQQAGDLEGAIATLERMLVFAPGLPRLQFELGVLYFRLGAYQPAIAYFEAVQAAPDVPADVQAQVALYLDAIEGRASGSRFAARVMTGVTWQSNANAGPGSATVNLNGFNFTLSPGAMAQPDASAFASVSADGRIDLGSQGDTFDIRFNGFGSVYRTLGSLNTAAVQLEAGPTFNLGRFSIDNATAGLYGIVGGALLGGAPYLGEIGLASELDVSLDARTALTLRGETTYEAYLDSAARPTASLRSGLQFAGVVEARHQLTPELGLFGALRLDRRNAQRAYLSSWQAGAEAGATLTFASPIAMLEAPWTLRLSGSLEHLVADAPDTVFSTTAAEQTTELAARAALTVPLPNDFLLETAAGYARSVSNYAFGNWDNVSLSASVGREF